VLADGQRDGVFTWLFMALILTPERFNVVWNGCSAQDGNNLPNLLLMLDAFEIAYDQGDFRLYFSNSKYPTYPLLRKEYLRVLFRAAGSRACAFGG
jgi:hypothetical protein